MNSKIGIIVAAAGSSTRFGSDKLFLALGGKPVIAWSVDVCQNYPNISQIILVLNASNIEKGKLIAQESNWYKVKDICLGGERRQDSVKEGLQRLKACNWVIIHDAARPFLTYDLLKEGLAAAKETGSAIAAVPVKDTIKYTDDNRNVTATPARSSLWLIQTPQVFRFDIISKAYEHAEEDVTDDATLVEKLGYQVKIFMGTYNNIKITTREDLAFARMLSRGIKSTCA